MLGYSHSELLDRRSIFCSNQDNPLLPVLKQRHPVNKRAEAAISVIGRYKNGKSGYFDVSLGRWRADQRDFVTTIWRDVTERVAADAALRDARDALQKSNEELEMRVEERTREREIALRQLHESQKMESIGQLTGGVAHDFNNLLAVILGSLGLLKKAVPDDPRVSRLLDRAIQGAERGATLTTRLLAFARRQELKVEFVALQKLIPEMLDFLRHSVGPNIVIQAEISPDVWAVEVDANQLELALINLAVNARDAMPQGGSLTIACHNEDRWQEGWAASESLRLHHRHRYRRGYERSNAGTSAGAVLHHEGRRQRHRTRPFDGAGIYRPIGWRNADQERAGQGNQGHPVAAARQKDGLKEPSAKTELPASRGAELARAAGR